ncbi:MAG: hypothetical protein K8R44_03685 [Sulfurimonas sp.]|nr:hypothetical protein [Sulfurimonas sp.]
MTDLENLCTNIINGIKSKGISFDLSGSNIYQIDYKNLNNILTIIFNLSSCNQHSFSILRKKYGECEIIIFDRQSSDVNSFTIVYIKQNNSLIYTIKSKIYNIKYSILKAIKIVPIIGPDGVGKTTLISEVITKIKQKSNIKKFKKIVRRSIVYNLVYPINKMLLKNKFGKKLEKDQYDDENAKLIILAGLLYYPFLVLISLLQNQLIFVDRFFHDILLRNISFMDKTTYLRKNWKLLLKFIPRTFWHIQLDAKSDIILNRKDELSLDDIDKYRKLNFQIYLEKPSIVYNYVNTGNNIKYCTDSIVIIANKLHL